MFFVTFFPNLHFMHHICNKFQEVSFIQQIFKISRMFSASFYIFSDFSAFMEIQSFLLFFPPPHKKNTIYLFPNCHSWPSDAMLKKMCLLIHLVITKPSSHQICPKCMAVQPSDIPSIHIITNEHLLWPDGLLFLDDFLGSLQHGFPFSNK